MRVQAVPAHGGAVAAAPVGGDDVESVRWLGPPVFHAAAKDATLCPGAGSRGVLGTSCTRVPADAPGTVPTGRSLFCLLLRHLLSGGA